jgi:hypothetical protein
VATSTERKKTEDMLGGLVEDRAGVAVEPSKNNREMNRRSGETAKRALANRISGKINYSGIGFYSSYSLSFGQFALKKGEDHEGRICSSAE